MKNGAWKLNGAFTMKGDGETAVFSHRDGRTLRVDYYDHARLQEHGLEANVEICPEGPGWENPEGRPIPVPKLCKYMIKQILKATT